MNKVLPVIAGGPAINPLQQSAELLQNSAKQIQN
jgi:hypothetical protein